MDIICLVLQAGGAGWTQAENITPKNIERAINVLRAGLGMQVASLSVFIVLAIDLAYRVIRRRNLWSIRFVSVREKRMFKPMLLGKFFSLKLLNSLLANIILILSCLGFFAAGVLILIRSAYRIQELSKGFVPPEDGAEVLYMILEGGMIGLASIILVLVHPGPVFGPAWKGTSFFSKQPKEDEVTANNSENGVELTSGHKVGVSVSSGSRLVAGRS